MIVNVAVTACSPFLGTTWIFSATNGYIHHGKDICKNYYTLYDDNS